MENGNDSVIDIYDRRDGNVRTRYDVYLAGPLFNDEDNIIMKLKHVSMDAVKKIAVMPEDGEPIDYENLNNVKFEDIDDDVEGTERYEKIKFNNEKLYQIDIANYLPYIETIVDMPEDDTDDMDEGFYNYYYRGE
jgi:hypothetical protein